MMTPDKNRALRIIAEIIRQAGGELTGTTRLYKAFYFAHLYYAESAPGYLSDWPIVKMPNGPGIDSGNQLIAEMKDAGVLSTDHVHVGPFQAMRFRLSGKEPLGDALAPEAVDAIRRAVQLVQDKAAGELSELIRDFSRSWNLAKEGEELNTYIDLIPDDEYASDEVRLREIRQEIEAAWGSCRGHEQSSLTRTTPSPI
jgi:hypothetical protein